MKDFLTRADQLRRESRTGTYADDFDRVNAAISELTRVHSKAQLNLDDLEEVFGAFEMARVIQRFPGLPYKAGRNDNLLQSFRNLITCTLEESINYPFANGTCEAPASYRKLAELLRRLQKSRQRQRSTAITFNYDYALDLALFNTGIGIDYGLDDKPVSDTMP